jgi:hypothetical protein
VQAVQQQRQGSEKILIAEIVEPGVVPGGLQ